MSESKEEREVRQALEAKLDGGETLLGYAKCVQANLASLFYGGSSSRMFYVGLTPSRLILLPYKGNKNTEEVLRIDRGYVSTATVHGSPERLKIEMFGEPLNLVLAPKWARSARMMVGQLANSANKTPAQLQSLADQMVQLSKTLDKLGLTRLAQAVVDRGVKDNPNLRLDPLVDAWGKQVTENLFAVKVAAAFILGEVVLILLASLSWVAANPSLLGVNLICQGVGLLLLGQFALSMWRAQVSGRDHARWIAFVSIVIALLSVFGNLDLQEAIAGLALGLSLALVLFVGATRPRSYAAIGIYVMGYFLPTAWKWVSQLIV